MLPDLKWRGPHLPPPSNLDLIFSDQQWTPLSPSFPATTTGRSRWPFRSNTTTSPAHPCESNPGGGCCFTDGTFGNGRSWGDSCVCCLGVPLQCRKLPIKVLAPALAKVRSCCLVHRRRGRGSEEQRSHRYENCSMVNFQSSHWLSFWWLSERWNRALFVRSCVRGDWNEGLGWSSFRLRWWWRLYKFWCLNFILLVF